MTTPADHPLQRIRRAIEEPIEQALSALGIPSVHSNELLDDLDASSTIATVDVSFGRMGTIDIGCQAEWVKGDATVRIYTPKGIGPGRAQDAAVVVLQALAPFRAVLALQRNGVVLRTQPAIGPEFTPLEKRPHFMAQVSVPFSARVSDAPAPAP